MGQENYKAAEAILQRVESAQVDYPTLHFGDTPAKVRRDLEKLQGNTTASGQPEKPAADTASRLNFMGAENPAGGTAATAPILAARLTENGHCEGSCQPRSAPG